MLDYSTLIQTKEDRETHYRYNQFCADYYETQSIRAIQNKNILDFKMYSNLADGFKLRVKEICKIKL